MSPVVQHLHANIGDAVRQDQVIAELEKHDQQALLGSGAPNCEWLTRSCRRSGI